MNRIDIEPKGRFSTALKIAIEASGMSLTEVAQKTDATYENMRKIVGGRSFPSPPFLRVLCQCFAPIIGKKSWETLREEWAELIEADKLAKKYKKLPKFLGVPPEVEPFTAIIPHLSAAARETLLATAKALHRQETGRK